MATPMSRSMELDFDPRRPLARFGDNADEEMFTRSYADEGGGGSFCSSPRVDNKVTSRPPAWCDRKASIGSKTHAPRGSSCTVYQRNSNGSVTPPVPGQRTPQPQASFDGDSNGSGGVKGDVSLYIRLRPGADEEICVHAEGRNGVRLKQAQFRQDGDVLYRCDQTFAPDASQEDVYQHAVTPICDAVIRGYNGAVIAYGQTGSGKTHTMIGNAKGARGVAPQAVTELFEALERRQNWAVEVSVLEIYNERVRDLLAVAPGVTHVDIHETCSNDGNLSFRCPDATTWKASTPDDALAALTEGMRRRETAPTDMNHNSSRSHLIFTLCATQSDDDMGATIRGRLHLVDLAGSERLKRSMSSDRSFWSRILTPRSPLIQRREAGEINKSLSQLALVIQRLTNPSFSSLQYVPYRDSMLTRLLAECFGGNSKTCVIITCSTLSKDREETRSSLEFGKRAKLVKNNAEINFISTALPENNEAHQLGMRVAQLEGELRMRQDRLTEAEGRLEAQRAYLEEVNETLSKVRNEKDGLMETKGSLEAQLRLEVSHKDALNTSLQQSADESEKRCRDLEERLLRDRDLHKDQLDEVRRSIGEEMKQGTERLAAVEAELLTARQRCELLARNKADLLQEVAENNSKLANVDAKIKEQADKNDTISLELDQTKQARESLEEELRTLRDEKRQCDARIDELCAEVKSKEDAKDALQDDFKLKVQRLDDLLNEERKLRQSTEETLGNARNDTESKSQETLSLRRKMEQELLELRSSGDTWKDKADDLGLKLQSTKEQLEAQKTRTDEIDSQRREIESKLRGDLATSEARLRRVEQESQRATAAVEEGRATLAETQATMTARIASLEQQLAQNKKDAETAASARESAQKDLQSQTDGHRQNSERLGMAAEELFTRQVEFALEKQRLSGALEESRRTLRNSLITPNPSTAIDTVRVQTLEKQLAEERRKSIEQAVALQRSDRKCTQLEDSNKRSEEHRQAAIQNSRDAERRCVTLAEDLRKAQLKQNLTDQKCEETRERAAMGAAEIQTVKYLSKYECAKLRGHLEELRYMIKRTDCARK